MDDPTSTTFTQTPTHEQISRRAEELWEQYGRPSGRDEDIWLEAERLLRSGPNSPATSPSASAESPVPRLDDGNTAPAAKPTKGPTATTPTAIGSAPKLSRAGGKRKPGGGAK